MNNKYKIGITCKDSSRIFSNGLSQNAYFLIKLLCNIGYDAVAVSQLDEAGKYLEDLEIKKLSADTIRDYDIIIEVCYSVTDGLFDLASKLGIKIVTINYGNILMLIQQDLIMKSNSMPSVNRQCAATWISPHFEFSKGFIEATAKNKVSICPYIWDPIILDKYCNKNNLNPHYSDNSNLNKVGIFEPNINIIKTCIYPIISLERLERENPAILGDILVFNTESLKDNPKFKEILHNFDIFKNKKISVESRYPLSVILSRKYIGTVLSHQFYCDLNYLTLECLYTSNPIVHNSEACKDGGYFYKTFDTEDCINKLKYAINHHHDNLKIYKKSSAEILYKFSINNNQNTKKYKDLIENIG